MGLFSGGNKSTTQNEYDYSDHSQTDILNDSRDMSTNSYAYDNSVSTVEQTSITNNEVSDFGAIKEAFNFASGSVDVMSSAVTDSLNFGAKALDFQSDTAKEAFQLVDDSQDAAYGFSNSSQAAAYGFSSDAMTRTLDAMGGVLDLNNAMNSEALKTVSDLTADIATGGAVTTGQNMNKAMQIVAVVAVVAVIAVTLGKRK